MAKTRNTPYLKWSFSILGFVLLMFMITGVLLDSALASVPQFVQRATTILLIVLPAFIGALLGAMSFRVAPRKWLLSVFAVLANGLAALFFMFIVLFAG